MTIDWKKTKSIVSTVKSHPLLMSNDNDNDIELVGKAKIKANKRFFNSIVAANKYVEILTFREDCFHI